MVDDRPPHFATLAVHGGTAAIATAAIEQRVALLEAGTAAVAVRSGPLLLVTALQPLMRPGDHVIIARQAAHASLAEAEARFAAFGWEVRWADVDEQASFERAVTPKTQAILVAVIAASGEVADIAALAMVAKRAQVPLIVDNGIATPALCRPIEFGADIVVHSDGRFVAGTDAGVGFIVDGGRFNWLGPRRYPALSEKRAAGNGVPLAEAVGNFAYAAACREFMGPAALSFDAERVTAGLETLPIRMAQHTANARAVAEALAEHKAIASVAYAGLPGDRHHTLAQKYCRGAGGALITFRVDGGAERAGTIMSALMLIAAASDQSPAKSSLVAAGDSADGMLTLHIGLEDPADVIADLEQALAAS